MLKPDKNFKLPKRIKRILSSGNFKGSEDRSHYKRLMIQSLLYAEENRRSKK